jgi:hypothetical protein
MLNLVKRLCKERPILAFLAVLMFSMAVSFGFAPAPAEAATGCTDGDRSLAASLASSGNFVDAGVTNIVGGKISLRYSSESGCAWGLISDLGAAAEVGGVGGYVWLDRSSNGGRTWQQLAVRHSGLARSTYTGTFNTIGNDAIRACGQTVINVEGALNPREGLPYFNPIGCTAWFYPGRLWPEMTMGGRGFDSLSSPNNRYVLRMQNDGNFVLYSWGRPVWAINKFYGDNTIVKMQGDGNLVVIAPGGAPVWASGTNRPGSYLRVQDDGNVVIYHGGTPVWATNTVGR